MNSLFNQLHQQQTMMMQQNASLPSKSNFFQQCLNSSNPTELLNSLISNNPQMKNVMNLLQSSGMTPKQFFYQYARQNGIDPDQFLNSLKSRKE